MRATGFGIAALVLGLLATGCKQDRKAPPPQQAELPLVYVTEAVQRDIRVGASVIGQVTAENRVELCARVRGFLIARNFDEGAMVKKGDVLFRIEPDEYAADVEKARADIDKAQSIQIRNETDFQRQKELREKNAISQREYDNALAARKNSEAEVAAAQAQLKLAQLNLNYTTIVAPFDGMIGYSAYSVGSLVGPDSGTLATVVSLDPIYIDFNVNELKMLDLLSMDESAIPDLVVNFRFQNQTDYPLPGKLQAMNNEVSTSTGTLKFRAVFSNPKLTLRPGMYGRVTVSTDKGISSVLVPSMALASDIEGDYLYIVGNGDKVERRNVVLGQDQGAWMVIQSGVKPGERVITSGIQKSRIGQPVKPEQDPNFATAAPAAAAPAENAI